MSFQQAQAEGLCLRYPENFGLHTSVNYENAMNMLLRAVQLSQQIPYSWSFIDKPQEGQVLLLFLPQAQTSFPIDGLRYQDQEVRFTIPAGSNRELEVTEIKYGFIPGSTDNSAWRVRRRYRLHKGGHPQLVLVHYTRGPAASIVPSLLGQPVRSYPLRPINEPAIFVMGDKAGQKVYPGGTPNAAAPPPQPHGIPPGAHAGQFNPQAKLMEYNNSRRDRERGRDRSGSMSARPAPPRIEDDDSADEADQISTRTLALTRYRRNHELMEEVFKHAAFGDKKTLQQPSPYSIFTQLELEEKMAKLTGEVEELKELAARRKAKREEEEATAADAGLEAADMSTEGIVA